MLALTPLEILAASEDKPETNNYWMLVLAVVDIAAGEMVFTNRKANTTA